MRLSTLIAPLALTIALLGPAAAQQISPMTGTTAAPPAIPAPTDATPSSRPPRPPRTRMTMAKRFEAANTTHDGKLTLDQAKAANMTRIVNRFDAIDSTKKGYVTMEDLRAYGRAQRAARKAAAAPK